jgi:hypothetical protein
MASLILLNGIFILAFSALPQISDLSLDLSNDPEWGTTALNLNQAEGSLEIRGPLTRSTPSLFKDTLARNPSIKMIIINSDGGRMAPALEIAEAIRLQHADTKVTNYCRSACTLVFSAGQHRLVTPGAKLGFHGYALGGVDTSSGTDEVIKFMTASGIKEEFARHALSIPNKTMWYPSIQELLASKMITEVDNIEQSK